MKCFHLMYYCKIFSENTLTFVGGESSGGTAHLTLCVTPTKKRTQQPLFIGQRSCSAKWVVKEKSRWLQWASPACGGISRMWLITIQMHRCCLVLVHGILWGGGGMYPEPMTLTLIQVKVREATSNDPWGPSSTQMSEIADLTYNMVSSTLTNCIP